MYLVQVDITIMYVATEPMQSLSENELSELPGIVFQSL